MPEKKSEQQPESVPTVDRRRFTSSGERRADAPREENPRAQPAPSPSPAARQPKAPAAAETQPQRDARQAYQQQAGTAAGRQMDFETLVLSLSTSAMLQLGMVDDPLQGGRPPADFEAARQTIDLLGILQEKTRGNLTPQEQHLLEQVLYELRLSYASLARGQGPAAPSKKA